MPNVELRPVEAGLRSTLFVSSDGTLYRKYHDTETWHGPLPVHVDDHGFLRCAGNRRVERLVQNAWGGFRGANATPPLRTPAHLHHVSRVLMRHPDTIEVVARECGVQPSTAWSYVCKAVERWPHLGAYAKGLVYPPLLTCALRSGSLREVMQHVERELSGDVDWRCVHDRYAHLRLARLCLQAIAES